MNYTTLIVFLFFFYWLLVALLDRRGTLSKYNITAYGPVLMLRTTKGQAFLDRLAVHKRAWRLFANIGLPTMLIGMFAFFLVILLFDYIMIMSFQTNTVPLPSKFNEPRNIFLIPGINEFIPLWYGIIALIVTLVVHEFSHAILCKVEGIKVKSMGILVALIPIGGFAEPDEEQLLGKKEEGNGSEKDTAEAEPKKFATRSERVRVLTAGVMANFVTALIAFVLFFSLLGSISPVANVMITNVVSGSPAQLAGVQQNSLLIGINDKQVNSANDFLSYAIKPGSNVTLHVIENGAKKNISMVATGNTETKVGVTVSQVIKDSPAEKAGIKAGMILVRMNNTEIKVLDDFINFMNSTTLGEKVDVYLLSNSSENVSTIVFRNIELSKYPQEGVNKGFLGVSYSPEEGAVSYSIGIGIGEFPAKEYLGILKSIPSMMTGFTGWGFLLGLPFFGGMGGGGLDFSGVFASFYEPTGWAVNLGAGTFWLLNILLWVGWMNLYVGLFNCLPAVPLDGGHVFRDVVTSSLSKILGNGEKAEKVSSAIAIMFAVLILISLVFWVIAPYAAHGF